MGYFHVVWGILAVVGAMLSFIPNLAMLTWIVYPFAAVGLMFAWFALENQSIRAHAFTGFILDIVAVVIALIHTLLIFILGWPVY